MAEMATKDLIFRFNPCVIATAAVEGQSLESSNVVGNETAQPESHETFVQAGGRILEVRQSPEVS